MRDSSLSITSPPTIAHAPLSSTAVLSSDSSTNASNSDSGSDAGSHQGEDSRSIIRKHVSFRPRSSSPPSWKKGHLLGTSNPTSDHVPHSQTNADSAPKSNSSFLRFRSRSRGLSGSSLLNPTIKINSVSSENLPQNNGVRQGTEYHRQPAPILEGPAASADNSNPATHQLQVPQSSSSGVDNSFISAVSFHTIHCAQFFLCIHPQRYHMRAKGLHSVLPRDNAPDKCHFSCIGVDPLKYSHGSLMYCAISDI